MRNLDSVTFAVPHLETNSLGRAYCLWLLAQANGWDAEIVAPTGPEIWPPLQGTAFAEQCRVITGRSLNSYAENLRTRSQLLIGVTPWASSIRMFQQLKSLTGLPGFFDMDDPTLDAMYASRSAVRRVGREILRPRQMRELRRTRQITRETLGTVSNPVLADHWGGRVIPHVRPAIEAGVSHNSWSPVIAFTGTARPHKGVEMLRAAVATLQEQGFKLVITDDPPIDAKPWESWIGRTSLDQGIRLVQQSDIVVAASNNSVFASAQLPVKLVDAMLAGRAVVVSNVGPLPWAVGDAGVIVKSESLEALLEGLASLRDPRARQAYGRAARELALERYTVDAQAPVFREVCEAAVAENLLVGRANFLVD